MAATQVPGASSVLVPGRAYLQFMDCQREPQQSKHPLGWKPRETPRLVPREGFGRARERKRIAAPQPPSRIFRARVRNDLLPTWDYLVKLTGGEAKGLLSFSGR